MTGKRQKKKARQQTRKQNVDAMRSKEEAKALADDPLADSANFVQVGDVPDIDYEMTTTAEHGSRVVTYKEIDETKEEDSLLTVPETELPPVIMPEGAETWEDLEIAEKEEVVTSKVAKVADEAQTLLDNILAGAEESPLETAEKVANVSTGLKERITAIVGKKEFDPDLALAEILMKEAGIGKFAYWTADKGGSYEDLEDESAVKAAIVRAVQELRTGGDIAREALPAIQAAATKFGIGTPSKKNSNALLVQKDKSGKWRWIGWVSNNFKDRDGDIITEEAHKEFIGYLNENPGMAPEFWAYHTKGTARASRADWWSYDKGFLMMSGPLEENEAIPLLKMTQKHQLGMSHGFFAAAEQEGDTRLITKYRTFEVSDLPLDRAANPWTSIETLLKEKDMNQREYLVGVLGEDSVAKLEQDTQAKEALLQVVGVEQKEVTEEVAPEAEAKEEEAISDGAPEMDAILETVSKKLDIPGLSEWVTETKESLAEIPELKEQIAQLTKSDDEKLAEKIAPPAASVFGWSPASESKDNVMDDDEETPAAPSAKGGDGEWDIATDFGAAPLPPKENV